MERWSDYAQLFAKAFVAATHCHPHTERDVCSPILCTPKPALDTVCPFLGVRPLAKIRPDWGSSISIEIRGVSCKSVYAQNKCSKDGAMKPMEEIEVNPMRTCGRHVERGVVEIW